MRLGIDCVMAGLLIIVAVTAPVRATTTNAVYPASLSAKYAKDTSGQARLHTCLDQYTANKAAHANGGLAWIQKGGGYYSACSKRLKSHTGQPFG